MSQSLPEKIGTIVVANLHATLDGLLNMNSPVVVREQIRQIDIQLDKIGESIIGAAGEVKSATRRLETLQSNAQTIDRSIDLILSDPDITNDEYAHQWETELSLLEKDVADQTVVIRSKQEEQAELERALQDLKNKREAVVQNLANLEAQLRVNDAKAGAAQANSSVDEIAEQAVTDALNISAQQDAAFDRDRVHLESAAVTQQIEVKQRLAARRARLGLESTESATTEEPNQDTLVS